MCENAVHSYIQAHHYTMYVSIDAWITGEKNPNKWTRDKQFIVYKNALNVMFYSTIQIDKFLMENFVFPFWVIYVRMSSKSYLWDFLYFTKWLSVFNTNNWSFFLFFRKYIRQTLSFFYTLLHIW